MMDNAAFRKELRSALNHLHNRDYLQQSPLIELFGLGARFDAPAVLQRLLKDGIEALRPPPGEPLHSEKRQVYEILLYRYIQQFTQQEVAHHIGVSNRQFRREQDMALEILATHLWENHHLEQPAKSVTTQMVGEWHWLKNAPAERVANLPHFVSEIFAMMRPVAEQAHVILDFQAGDLPDLAVHPVAFRQILLNLLAMAIHRSSRGKVQMDAVSGPSSVDFHIQAGRAGFSNDEPVSEQDGSLLQIAADLANLSGGRLSLSQDPDVFDCRLALPVAEGIDILVVDDNAEIIELLSRYATGTRYRLASTQNPEEAVEKAIALGPRIIVLDVMMPKVDGWELLGRLRRHPQTAAIPVIILTILAQVELARTLGARALVLKPVTRERFLSALDEVLTEMSSDSR